LNHFRVVEVLDAKKDRDLEHYGLTGDLKRNANVGPLRASRSQLDARHRDLKFVHPSLGLLAQTSIPLLASWVALSGAKDQRACGG
jgi:hypothetical protein